MSNGSLHCVASGPDAAITARGPSNNVKSESDKAVLTNDLLFIDVSSGGFGTAALRHFCWPTGIDAHQRRRC
ncbi:hypothetical protein D1871_16865 [Nakamurella silvestris]|nr:hypothetical protein D1871_16865 [Nakamurella silvestris]